VTVCRKAVVCLGVRYIAALRLAELLTAAGFTEKTEALRSDARKIKAAIPSTFRIRRRMGRTHHRLTPQKDVCGSCNVKAEDNIGLSEEGLNRPEEAATAFQTAISWQERPSEENAQPFLNLGSLLADEGTAEAGLRYLLKAGELDPRNAKCPKQLGRAYIKLNQLLRPNCKGQFNLRRTAQPAL
jgi:tetratricopeptide (TPR) repeat protein